MNMQEKKCPMPAQDAKIRANNFDEVALGYDRQTAVLEAQRCLQCKHKPCVAACPVQIDIPAFIAEVAKDDMQSAFDILNKDTSLAAVCGRVCPQESQCEGKCVRGIKKGCESVAIGRLERYVADWQRENSAQKVQEVKEGARKAAVVGSGPAGLAAAAELAKFGFEVNVYEALHLPGGVLTYGIPEFRLPKSIVQYEVSALEKLGVKIHTNVVVGRTLNIDELFAMGNEAVFVGSGAGLPNFMNIEGEALKGVFSANEFLTRINLMKAYEANSKTPVYRGQNIVVVGGGNVAMDAARCAKRLGANSVSVVYRRSLNELPARKEEVEHAIEEGIIFKTLTNPVRILGDENGHANKIECVEMELGEPDESGRRSPVVKKGSEFVIDADCVIMSIGTSPNPLISATTKGLEIDRRGRIITQDENGLTKRESVYAGGDAVTGAATVILAMGAGKKAAKAIFERK